MHLLGLEPTSGSQAKQVFCVGRGTNSRGVTDAGEAGDSREVRWRIISINEVEDRELKLVGFKLQEEQSDDLKDPEKVATAAIAECNGERRS